MRVGGDVGLGAAGDGPQDGRVDAVDVGGQCVVALVVVPRHQVGQVVL